MQKKKLNNQGFGLVGILIVILVLTVAGGGGYLVWHKNHKEKVTTTSSATTNSTSKTSAQNPGQSGTVQQTPTNQAGYLVIKEWGVEIKPASSLPNVSYAIDTSDGHQWAELTFADLPSSCSGFYHLNRAQAGQDLDGYGNTPAQLSANNPSAVKQVGDYYYYLGHGQGACSSDTSVTDKQNSLIQKIAGGSSAPNTYQVQAVN